MVEKFAASFAAVLAIVLGIWARITFVRRSEIYAKDGKPIYRHASDCSDMQHACNQLICNKIDEIKAAQHEDEQTRAGERAALQLQLSEIQQFIGRVEQYMRDHR